MENTYEETLYLMETKPERKLKLYVKMRETNPEKMILCVQDLKGTGEEERIEIQDGEDISDSLWENMTKIILVRQRREREGHVTKREIYNEVEQLKSRADYIKYEDISPMFLFLLVNAEDPKYFSHHGIDYKSTIRCLGKNIMTHSKQYGGSTITQQTVKNICLNHEKTYLRKGMELLLASYFEHVFSKKDILEMYCNIIEWGNGCVGIESAAKYYFNKSQDKLSINEMLQLICCMPNPLCNNPMDFPRENDICRRRQIQNYYKLNMFSFDLAHTLMETGGFGSTRLDEKFKGYCKKTLKQMSAAGEAKKRYKYRDATRYKGLK